MTFDLWLSSGAAFSDAPVTRPVCVRVGEQPGRVEPGRAADRGPAGRDCAAPSGPEAVSVSSVLDWGMKQGQKQLGSSFFKSYFEENLENLDFFFLKHNES